MGAGETKVYIAILIAAAVIGVILLYFIITILRQQKSNFRLYQSKIQAEIITLEKERERMSRDLHDDFAPILLAVKYNINSLELSSAHDESTLEKSNAMLDGMVNRVREISNDLVPDSLQRQGLIPALEELANRDFGRSGLAIELRCKSVPDLAQEKSVNIYRIVQELVHNTVKHAKAKKLLIELKAEGNRLFLLTEDNGIGFDYPARAKDFSGLGLRSLLSRADFLNGTMYLDSKAGKGTRYTFEIPF